jgi:hypothetical protein
MFEKINLKLNNKEKKLNLPSQTFVEEKFPFIKVLELLTALKFWRIV